MLGRTLAGLAALGTLAASVAAQVPATPVLQNAFANPGLAIAVNYGGAGGQTFYGAAAALGLGGGKLQLSGAAGAGHGNGATRGAYGGRVAATVWQTQGGSLGAGGFVGVGGAPRTRANNVITNPALMSLPAGISVGYRRPMGTSRGVSAYVSPMYVWTRSDSGVVTSSGSMRVAVGLDFAFSQSLGVTVGGDFGGRKGSSGTDAFGAALSFVPGRR